MSNTDSTSHSHSHSHSHPPLLSDSLFTSLSPHPNFHLSAEFFSSESDNATTEHANGNGNRTRNTAGTGTGTGIGGCRQLGRIELSKFIDCSQLKKPLDSSGLAQSRYYLLYHIDSALYFRELECFRADFDSEPLLSIKFNVNPTAHAANRRIQSSAEAELLTGFASGALLVYCPFHEILRSAESRDKKFNSTGFINNARVIAVSWIPSDSNQFIAAHSDGRLFVYDKRIESEEKLEIPSTSKFANFPQISYSARENRNPTKQITIAVGRTKVATIAALAFSTDGSRLAIALNCGWLCIVDYSSLSLLAAFESDYGGYLCLDWSSDSSRLIAGGEDDLVSLFDLSRFVVAARFEGHKSWVASVKFLSSEENCIDRFISGSMDGEMLVWEWKQSNTKPKANWHQGASNSASPSPSVSASASDSIPIPTRIPIPVIVHSPPRGSVRVFPPVARNYIHQRGIAQIATAEQGNFIVSICEGAVVRFWSQNNYSKQAKFIETAAAAAADSDAAADSAGADAADPIDEGIRTPILSKSPSHSTL